jgi:hypothetical protein
MVERLIKHKEAGSTYERAGYRDALALSSGQLCPGVAELPDVQITRGKFPRTAPNSRIPSRANPTPLWMFQRSGRLGQVSQNRPKFEDIPETFSSNCI